jgi:3-hydroxyisobutyrate dehydrogenase-like beta-hydroxyacid dehydrogenase
MVATGPQLLDLLGADVVTGGHLAGAVLVVASTVGPDVLRDAQAAAAVHGIEVVDCPVSGGVTGARAGTLLLFAAGAPAALERVRPLLGALGTMHVVGERPGEGQALKLVNQMLVSIHLVAAAEAVAFAERFGLDPDLVVQLLPAGAAASWMLADRGPRMVLPASRRPTETELSIFVKDSGLVAAAAAATGVRFPLTQAARDVWQRANDLGLGVGDDSGVVEVFRQSSSVDS